MIRLNDNIKISFLGDRVFHFNEYMGFTEEEEVITFLKGEVFDKYSLSSSLCYVIHYNDIRFIALSSEVSLNGEI